MMQWEAGQPDVSQLYSPYSPFFVCPPWPPPPLPPLSPRPPHVLVEALLLFFVVGIFFRFLVPGAGGGAGRFDGVCLHFFLDFSWEIQFFFGGVRY